MQVISKPFFLAVTLLPILAVFISLVGLTGNIGSLYVVAVILMGIGFGLSLWLWYVAWAAVQSEENAMLPSKAVALLALPGLNLYWLFPMVLGYVKTYNQFVVQHSRGTRKLSEQFFFTTLVLMILSLVSIVVFYFGKAFFIDVENTQVQGVAFNIWGKLYVYPTFLLLVTTLVLWTQMHTQVCNAINRVQRAQVFVFPWSWTSIPSIIVLWMVVAHQFPAYLLPQFWLVLKEGMKQLANTEAPSIYHHLSASLQAELYGFGAAIVVSIVLGFLAGFYRSFREYLVPLNGLFMSIPPIAWAPLMLFLFGLPTNGPADLLIFPIAIIMVIFISAVNPMINCIIEGVLQIQGTEVKAARILGARPWQLFVYVYLPASLPYITTALRIGFSQAWRALVAAEIIGATAGIGYMVNYAKELGNSKIILLGIALIGGISWLFERLFFRPIEKRYEVWRLN